MLSRWKRRMASSYRYLKYRMTDEERVIGNKMFANFLGELQHFMLMAAVRKNWPARQALNAMIQAVKDDMFSHICGVCNGRSEGTVDNRKVICLHCQGTGIEPRKDYKLRENVVMDRFAWNFLSSLDGVRR